MDTVWLYFCVVTFACVISTATSLQCYQCDIIEDNTSQQKQCQEKRQCSQNSVCLSSVYNVTRDSDKRVFLAKVKTCAMKTGKECEHANAGHLQGYTVNSKLNCDVCEKDDCNNNRGSGLREASVSLLVTLCFASLIWSSISRS